MGAIIRGAALVLLSPSLLSAWQFSHVSPQCHSRHAETVYEDSEVPKLWKAMRHLGAEPKTASLLAPIVHEEAASYGVDPYVMVSIARQESNFRLRARGSKGEVGVFQIRPSIWLDELGLTEEELAEPRNNARACAHILSKYLRTYQDYPLALRAYNHRVHGTRYATAVLRRYERLVTTL